VLGFQPAWRRRTPALFDGVGGKRVVGEISFSMALTLEESN
jgi:hypothetical protein